MDIVIRADASALIGAGHVMRCLTLAEALRKGGATVSFICREWPGHLCDLIEQRGFLVAKLPAAQDTAGPTEWRGDAKETLAVMEAMGICPDWLVVDHYGLGCSWERALRPSVAHVMVIDDLASRQHDCDVLLDQNLSPKGPGRYAGLVDDSAVLLVGPEFALIREEFRVMRQLMTQRFLAVVRIFVGFGGADPDNAAGQVVSSLLDGKVGEVEIVVVAGAANIHYPELEVLCQNVPTVKLYKNTDRMAEILAGCDLAIGAGGVSALERCVLGIPSLIYSIADNQVLASEGLAGMGAARYMGKMGNFDAGRLIEVVRQLLTDQQARQAMSRAAMEMVDGNGALRIADLLLKSEKWGNTCLNH